MIRDITLISEICTVISTVCIFINTVCTVICTVILVYDTVCTIVRRRAEEERVVFRRTSNNA